MRLNETKLRMIIRKVIREAAMEGQMESEFLSLVNAIYGKHPEEGTPESEVMSSNIEKALDLGKKLLSQLGPDGLKALVDNESTNPQTIYQNLYRNQIKGQEIYQQVGPGWPMPKYHY